jgi:putative ABC transport system ATP-binding protein
MSVLSLAVPLSVQILIGSIANTALMRPLVVLGITLLALLALYGILYALQTWTMDRFERHFFARISEEIILRYLHARFSAMEAVNREELANRFFEIVTVQKNVPSLMVGGATLLLQALVGFVVVSAYHPAFVAFNGCILLVIWCIWMIWGHRSTESKIKESKAKYNVARWLEEIARANDSFKSERSLGFAVKRSEVIISEYLDAHRRHFGYKMGQLLACLALYAIASSTLLVVGGSLVLSGSLALGQLVAAELILATIFLAIAQLPKYLEQWYELRASLEKLGEFYAIPLEAPVTGERPGESPMEISFRDVTVPYRTGAMRFNFSLPAGQQVMIACSSSRYQKAIVDLLLRHIEPSTGSIVLGRQNLSDIHPHSLRDTIIVVDNAMTMECSIADNLCVGDTHFSRAQLRAALSLVALDEVIDHLPEGLDTVLSPHGLPLSRGEVIRLKIAAAILAKPRVLVLTEVFDTLALWQRRTILAALYAQDGFVLDFSTRRDIDDYDRYMIVNAHDQRVMDSLAALVVAERASGSGAVGAEAPSPT